MRTVVVVVVVRVGVGVIVIGHGGGGVGWTASLRAKEGILQGVTHSSVALCTTNKIRNKIIFI